MSVMNEIARTIHAIRMAADVDVERLCFEVSDDEWREIVAQVRLVSDPAKDPSYAESFVVMGIRVRRRRETPP